MKGKCVLAVCAAALSFSVTAAQIPVLDPGGAIVGVNGLTVGSRVFDARFAGGGVSFADAFAASPTFFGDPAGAAAAASGIADALNSVLGLDVAFGDPAGTFGFYALLAIPVSADATAPFISGECVSRSGPVDAWIPCSFGGDLFSPAPSISFVQFTDAVAVSEPGSAVMLGFGLLALGATMRRSRPFSN